MMTSICLKISGAVFVAIAAIAWSAPSAGEPVSSRAMVALSAKSADRKAKQDLLSILQPTGTFSTGNRAAVSGIEMRTTPHGSVTKGLCVMDDLFLQYGPTAAGPEPMDEPLRPGSLSVRHFYHAARDIDYVDDNESTDRAAIIGNTWSRDCEKLRSDKASTWFEADSGAEAVGAINALHAATDALRIGQLEAKGCDYPLRQGETCSQAILRVGSLDKIGTISRNCQAAAGQSCFELFLDDPESMAVTVVFSAKNYALAPEDVIEVRAGVYVTVT